MDTQAVLEQELAQIERDLKSAEERRTRLLIKRELVLEMRQRLSGATEKVGPTDAVRNLVRSFPGITRKDVVARAETSVTTAPEIARKTIKQTILNLISRGEITERGGGLYPRDVLQLTGTALGL